MTVRLSHALLCLTLACGGAETNQSSTPTETFAEGQGSGPPAASERVILAETQMAEGNFAAAKATLEQAVQDNDRDARAYYDLGIVEEELDNLAAAEAAYRFALNIKPDFVFAANNLGLLLHRLERDDEAKSVLLGAVEEEPDSATAHFNLGLVYNALGDSASALKHHEQAAKLAPEDMSAWLRVAWLHYSAKNQEAATRAAAKAYELAETEKQGRPLAELGGVLRLTGQFEPAIKVFDRALSDKASFADLDPTVRNEAFAAIYTERGLALSALGHDEGARKSFEDAIAREPTYPLAHYSLANLLANKGEWKPAIAAYEKFIELAPDGPRVEKAKAKLKKVHELVGK